jgi:hypothetical protein
LEERSAFRLPLLNPRLARLARPHVSPKRFALSPFHRFAAPSALRPDIPRKPRSSQGHKVR